MALTTQLRLLQMSGSLLDGQPALADASLIVTQSLQGPLNQMASAIRRITGAAFYGAQTAGFFNHATTTFSGNITMNGTSLNGDADEARTIFASNTSANLTLGGGGTVIAGGNITMNGTAFNGDADEARTIFAVNSGQPITLGTGGVVVTGGQLKVEGSIIQDAGGHARIGFPDAGDLTLADKDGNTAVTVNGTDKNVTLVANLDHADSAFSIGATMSTPATLLTLGGGATVVAGGDVRLATAGVIEDSGGHARFTATDAGSTIIGRADGTASVSVSDADLVTFVGNLDHANSAWTIGSTVTSAGVDITLGGGATLVAGGKIQLSVPGIIQDSGGHSRFEATDAGVTAIGRADGTTAIEVQTDSDVIFAGDLDHADSNWVIGAAVSTATNSITLGGGADVIAGGNLRLAASGIIENSAGEQTITVNADQQVQVRSKLFSDTSQILLLSASDGSNSVLGGNLVTFDEGVSLGSLYQNTGIKVGGDGQVWTDWGNVFGAGVSLMQGIISGSSAGETKIKQQFFVTGSGYAAGIRIPLNENMTSVSEGQMDKKADLYVNGQLMVSGSTKDYVLDGPHNSVSVKLGFAVILDDVITLTSR